MRVTRFKQFSRRRYYLKRIFVFRRDADLEALGLRLRGYKARVVPVAIGWAVYYR